MVNAFSSLFYTLFTIWMQLRAEIIEEECLSNQIQVSTSIRICFTKEKRKRGTRRSKFIVILTKLLVTKIRKIDFRETERESLLNKDKPSKVI